MSSQRILRLFTALYMTVFMAYLLAPLAMMSAAAFNSFSIPTIMPWSGFTLRWFGELFHDVILWEAIARSLVIAVGVIALSVPMGLAAALFLTQMRSRAKSLLYVLMVSPILIPGVIIGISTLIFWDGLGVSGGLFLTVIGQASFISSFCMLLFMARLQRFDVTLEEAALDLGADQFTVFRRILLPYLRPTILTAVGITFLQSFENYNTTLFVIGAKTTLSIRIASMVRLGLTPEVNALAIIFIGLTIVAAVAFETRRRREKALAASRAASAEAMDVGLVEPNMDAAGS